MRTRLTARKEPRQSVRKSRRPSTLFVFGILALLHAYIGVRILPDLQVATVVKALGIAGLPDALHGFTIAQISDIHVVPTIKRGHLDRIVDAVNAWEADNVAVTGDLVDGSVRRKTSARRSC